MGRTGITRDQVEAAATELRAAGRTPTVRAVRERLGDTGSLKTIADHLRALKTAAWEGPGPALPDPLLHKLVEGAAEFWAELADAADAAATSAERVADERVAHAESANRDAERRAATIANERDAHRTTIAALERHLADKERARVVAVEGLASAESRIGVLEADVERLHVAAGERRSELEATQRKLETARQEVQGLVEERKAAEMAYRKALAAEGDARRELLVRVDALENALAATQADRDEIEAQRTALSAERVALDGARTEALARLAQVQEERDAEIVTRRDLERALESERQRRDERESSLHRDLERAVEGERQRRDERESSLNEILTTQQKLITDLGRRLDRWDQVRRAERAQQDGNGDS